MGWPVFGLVIGTDSVSSLPTTSEARQGESILAEQYASFNANPLDVVVQSVNGASCLTPQNLADL